MKNILLLIIFSLSMSCIALSQIKRKAILIGGDLSGFTEKQINNNLENVINSFSVSPFIGKAIKENLIFGGYFNVGIIDNKGDNSINTVKDRIYGGGLFLRHYSVIKNNFYAFIQGNIGAGYSSQEFSQINNINGKSKRTTFSANISPGLSYRISKKLHLETGLKEIINLGYSHLEARYNNSGNITETNSKRFHFSSNLNNFTSSLYFGFRFLLNS